MRSRHGEKLAAKLHRSVVRRIAAKVVGDDVNTKKTNKKGLPIMPLTNEMNFEEWWAEIKLSLGEDWKRARDEDKMNLKEAKKAVSERFKGKSQEELKTKWKESKPMPGKKKKQLCEQNQRPKGREGPTNSYMDISSQKTDKTSDVDRLGCRFECDGSICC